LMTELNLPLPYAFNYHFDNGVFRGLAFANFTSAEEHRAVLFFQLATAFPLLALDPFPFLQGKHLLVLDSQFPTL
jgi:hypothetical protein